VPFAPPLPAYIPPVAEFEELPPDPPPNPGRPDEEPFDPAPKKKYGFKDGTVMVAEPYLVIPAPPVPLFNEPVVVRLSEAP
jgi:hypothetical protein